MPFSFAVAGAALESLQVVLMATVPFGELRTSIPFAISFFGMPPSRAFLLSVVGNMLPVVLLLLFLEPVSNWLRRFSAFDRFFDWLFSRTRRYNDRMEKYGSLGLIPFVAVPLPVTGAWTACAVAFVFGIRSRHAFSAIFAGVLLAGVVVTLSYVSVLEFWS
ncbi:ligand-binding protein SH3 [ANME-1 cluster archaeon ex4572_4]|nr:MAG: ligand-binding protein SH3 [ANME-1 cluster archaeon ex4572_4]PXF50325.1 MAG: ligand-binding protein SH3 [Methanophagales archaeon]